MATTNHRSSLLDKNQFFRRLKEREPSGKQRQVANYIARNYRTVASHTAAELAKAMGISEATVVRFARELGYSGFRELKRQLNQVIREDLTSVELLTRERTRTKGKVDTLAETVERESMYLRGLAADIRRSDYRRLVKALVESDRNYIVGHRASMPLAQFFGYTLAKVHKDTVTLTSSTSWAYDAFREIPPKSCMVAIGFARYPRETLELMEFARSQGILVIAITDWLLSPLGKRADFSLVVRTEPVSFVDSHCAPQALIASIMVDYGLTASKRTESMLKRFERIVSMKSLFYVDP